MKLQNLKTGFNFHRLIENDPYYAQEVKMVEEINKLIEMNHDTLAQIVNHTSHKSYLEEAEEKIVLSVIQWLGTPVGQSFLNSCNYKLTK